MDPVARSESATPRASGASTPQPSSKVQQPKPQALPSRSGPSAILVSTRQKGNPILNHIKLLPWEYADIPADYVVGSTTCALFLSLKYHRLHPEYIYSRIRLIAGKYLLRIILVIVDIPNHEESLKELSKTSIVNNMTLILCWSAPEAAHYLELFKSSENSQPTAIRTQQAQSYKESLVEFVTTPRSINKSDAASLISTFGSLQNAVNAQPEQISAVPGWGEKKVKQWCSTVREGFRVESAKRKTRGGIAGSHATGGVEGQEDKPFNPSETNEDTAAEIILADAEDGRLEARRQVVEDRRMQESSQQEGMSEGIMAALAKYREDGG
ncbi:mating-type switching protein Swi10 [Aspergillus costaricaensis CBS 115574]|uniref:Mating-type switching protein Swi10 n=1 Tax=Aspergillus costaricaensis CBS 115574 TaxID=1448317 RepID=A0ACD1HZA7_9EURO|nr:mating-type switching protein Swi10 [Aspergillus costaricaensis CBS 115574]RAK83146.1 mating-type switching protein Swi10 [Aspergillus costaricaensis CBS 115574]